MKGHLTDVINHAKFYLNQIRGFDSVAVEYLAFPQEREVVVNTWLELSFSLWSNSAKLYKPVEIRIWRHQEQH